MSKNTDQLTDDAIAQFLRTRSADAELGLLDDIVRTTGATAQDRPWLGLRPILLPRRTLSWLPLARASAVSVALVSILIALSVGLGLVAYRNLGTAPPTPSPAPRQGPVLRPDAAVMPVLPLTKDAAMGGDGWAWADGRDAALPWVDIGAVRWQREGQDHWYIELADFPPSAADLDPNQTIIEYGVVLDTNRDRIPDYEFGINNDAPEAGEFRVWVTDLAAGRTNEKVGGPYGFPVEFRHPDEQDPDDTMNGEPLAPSMNFTFLPGSGPIGPPDKVGPADEWQFYVWAKVTEGNEVMALDYGPDFGWLTATAP